MKETSIQVTELLRKGLTIKLTDGRIFVGTREMEKATSLPRDDFKSDNDANIEIQD